MLFFTFPIAYAQPPFFDFSNKTPYMTVIVNKTHIQSGNDIVQQISFVNLHASNRSGTFVPFFASGKDYHGNPIQPKCIRHGQSIHNGTINFPLNNTTIGCIATDGQYEAMINFTVDVRDYDPPKLNTSNIFTKVAKWSEAFIRYDNNVSATDNVDGYVNPSCTPPSGSIFHLGNTSVTCSARDKAGNASPNKTFTVTLSEIPPSPSLLSPTPSPTPPAKLFGHEASSNNPALNVTPSEIKIDIPYNKAKDLSSWALQLTSNQSIRNISTHFSDLEPDDKTNLPISRKVLSIQPNIFNLTAHQLTEADILTKLPNVTGTYRGMISFWYPGGNLGEHPIQISIRSVDQNLIYIGLVIVALGVIAAFVVKLFKLNLQARDSARH